MKKGKDSCFSVMMILYGTYDFIMERCGYCVDMFHKTENKINGYSFHEWSGFELDDCTLTMKFNDIDAPVFIIKSNGKIREFRHKLEAFGSNKYTTTNGFKELVQRKLSPC